MNRGNSIGSRIEKLRKTAGLTQAELGKKMGVKRETIVQWESNTRDLKTAATIALADHFGVTCDYILRGVSSELVDVYKKTGLTEETINVLKDMRDRSVELGWNAIEFILTNKAFSQMFGHICEIGYFLRNHRNMDSIIEDGGVLFLDDLPETVKDAHGTMRTTIPVKELAHIFNLKTTGEETPRYITSSNVDEIKKVLIESFGKDSAIISINGIIDYSSYNAQKLLTILIDDVKNENFADTKDKKV